MFQKFEVDDMERFIDEASTPLVTLFDQKDPNNQPFVSKYFDSSDSKVQILREKTLIHLFFTIHSSDY